MFKIFAREFVFFSRSAAMRLLAYRSSICARWKQRKEGRIKDTDRLLGARTTHNKRAKEPEDAKGVKTRFKITWGGRRVNERGDIH